jgi:hypothetical protein
MSARVRPGLRWKRVDGSSTPVVAQSLPEGLIGDGAPSHIGSLALAGPRTVTLSCSTALRAGAAACAWLAAER